MDDGLQGKRIFVWIRNTRPSEVSYVSFEGQSVDGRKAMISDRLAHSLELILIGGTGQTIFLAPHFLIPDHPTKDKQVVVVLEGERKGQAFKTIAMKDNPTRFGLSPIALTKRKALLEMDSSKLAIADLKPPPKP